MKRRQVTLLVSSLVEMRFVVATSLVLASVAAAQATQGTSSPNSSQAVKTAEIAVFPSNPGELTLAIKNLGSVPIEAWGFKGNYLEVNGKERLFHLRTDTYPWLYLDTPPRDGEGPIKPGEQRLIPQPVERFGRLVDLQLTFVLFDNMKSEGETAELAEVFHGREADARAADAVLASLKDAQRLAPGQARARLISNATVNESDSDYLKNMKQLVASVASKSDTILASRITWMVDHFEKRKAAALRHKTGK